MESAFAVRDHRSGKAFRLLQDAKLRGPRRLAPPITIERHLLDEGGVDAAVHHAIQKFFGISRVADAGKVVSGIDARALPAQALEK
jgi:hypothetical protein